MTVYIEYAFLQNLLLDGALIYLAAKATKTPVKWSRVLFSSLFGAVFAVVYPLLKLTQGLGFALKIAAGLLLCMLSFQRLSTKKSWGRFGLFASVFFALSFLFGGALLSVTQALFLNNIQSVITPLGFFLLSVFCVYLIRGLYKKRTLWRHIYPCKVIIGESATQALGFLDSGNAAEKNGVPVCFLSPETAYGLWGEKLLLSEGERGQVCDELQITTMTGVRKVRLYKGALEIEGKGKTIKIKEVYFAVSGNIISREYTMILHSRIFDEGEEV